MSNKRGSLSRSPWEIQTRFILLLIAIFIPFVVLHVFDTIRDFRTQKENQIRNEIEVARAVADGLVTAIQNIRRQQLTVGTALMELPRDAHLRATQIMETAISESPAIHTLNWVAPSGEILFSTNPKGVGVNLKDRPYFQEILLGSDWSISDLIQSGRLTNEPTVLVSRAITDKNGLRGVVVGAIEPGKLHVLSSIFRRPSESAFSIFDTQGHVVFRFPPIDMSWENRVRWKSTDNLLVESLATGKEQAGIISLMAVDRRPWISARVPIQEIGWVAGTGRRLDSAMQGARANAIQQTVWLIAIVLASLLAGLWIARGIVSPIRRLEADMRTLERTHEMDSVSLDDPAAPKEVQNLRKTLFQSLGAIYELKEQQENVMHLISHDLRTPLTAISLQAQLAQRSLEKAPSPAGAKSLSSAIRGISTNALRMAMMISDLIEVARADGSQLHIEKRPLDFNSYLNDVLGRCSGVLDATRIEFHPQPNLPQIHADPDRLERILINLVSNALKYSPATKPVRIDAEQDGDYFVRISIQDEGKGIQEDDLPHVFDRYFRGKTETRADGLGLGLYITRTLVEAHGGSISARSSPGQGSTFSFLIPIAPAAPSAPSPQGH